MNKNDLVSGVSDSAGISKSDATKVVDSVLEDLKRGGRRSEIAFRSLVTGLRGLKDKELEEKIENVADEIEQECTRRNHRIPGFMLGTWAYVCVGVFYRTYLLRS